MAYRTLYPYDSINFHLPKLQICPRWYYNGICRDSYCIHAHAHDELEEYLQEKYWLTMCPNGSKCLEKSTCIYAHRNNQIRRYNETIVPQMQMMNHMIWNFFKALIPYIELIHVGHKLNPANKCVKFLTFFFQYCEYKRISIEECIAIIDLKDLVKYVINRK